jgi:hypothetical protein
MAGSLCRPALSSVFHRIAVCEAALLIVSAFDTVSELDLVSEPAHKLLHFPVAQTWRIGHIMLGNIHTAQPFSCWLHSTINLSLWLLQVLLLLNSDVSYTHVHFFKSRCPLMG